MINKIKIIVIGKIKEKYIDIGVNEFIKRIKVFSKIEIIELKDSGIIKDTKNILETLKNIKHKNIFILDEKGSEYASIEFSNLINTIEEEIVLIIGGADGLEKSIKEKYKTICLSKMTFTHEMARLFLLEQLYRSFMILKNRSYHK